MAVVVTYNAEDLIAPCLSALSALDLSRVEVLDNASTDKTMSVLESLSESPDGLRHKLAYRQSGVNLGFGRAVNAVVGSLAPCDAVLLVNPDCILPAATYQRMITYLVEHSAVSAVAPGMTDGGGRRRIAGGAAPTLLKETLAFLHLDAVVPPPLRRWLARRQGSRARSLTGYLATLIDGAPVAMDWVSGFCLLVRMSAWRQVGGFDPSFFLYFEDVDLCDRLRRVGGKVVCLPDVTAQHLGSVSTTRVGKRRVFIDGLRVYFEKNGSPFERRVIRLMGALR